MKYLIIIGIIVCCFTLLIHSVDNSLEKAACEPKTVKPAYQSEFAHVCDTIRFNSSNPVKVVTIEGNEWLVWQESGGACGFALKPKTTK